MNILKSKLLQGTMFSLALLPAFASSMQAQAKTAPKCKTITPITMFFHYRDRMSYNESLPIMKYVEQHTCTKIISKAPKYASKSLDVLNLHLGSGHIADVVGIDNFKDIANKYGIKGAFMPLNKLIDKYAPHIKKAFDTIPGAKVSVQASDGNIYYLPQFNSPLTLAAKVYFIRKDWLDKLHLPVPKTIQELEKTLIAFRDQDPNGNGRKDEIPYCGRYWTEAVRLVTLFGARTAGSDSNAMYVDKNNHVQYPFIEGKFKTAYKHLIKWYKEKLIDPQIFTRGRNSREILFSRNQCGMTHDWASTIAFNDSLQKKVPGFKLYAMNPPVGTDGSQFEENAREIVRKDGWGMSAKTKHPIKVIKFLDWYYSPEGSALNNFGLPGVSYNLVNGVPHFTKEVMAKPHIQDYLSKIGAVAPLGFVMDANADKQLTTPVVRDIFDRYTKYLVPQYSGVSYTPEEQRLYDRSWTIVDRNIVPEYLQKWLLGSADIDKTWSEYLKKIKQTGFMNLLKATQVAYDRTYNIKKK